MCNRLYRHFVEFCRNSIICWDGVSGKHPVFLNCYRLALGRASSCKTLLQCMIWQFAMQFIVKGWLETTRLKVSLMVGLMLDVSLARLLQLSHQNFRVCSWNVGLLRGQSCGLQEVIWRVASARLVEAKDSRYKIFWGGDSKGMGGVGILVTVVGGSVWC